MTDEEAFQSALDADSTDFITRGVFADWLEEQGDERAPGYRAMAQLRIGASWTDGIKFASVGGTNHPHKMDTMWFQINRGWLIPHDWFLKLGEHPRDYWDGDRRHNRPIWKRDDNRRKLDDRIARAWLLLSPERRAELLAQAERALR